jgi:hypothetical protein
LCHATIADNVCETTTAEASSETEASSSSAELPDFYLFNTPKQWKISQIATT